MNERLVTQLRGPWRGSHSHASTHSHSENAPRERATRRSWRGSHPRRNRNTTTNTTAIQHPPSPSSCWRTTIRRSSAQR